VPLSTLSQQAKLPDSRETADAVRAFVGAVRSTRDLLNVIDAVARPGASFKSAGDQWRDTTTPHGKLMLTVLGGLAEFERHLILFRTDEGRKRARSNGIKFGRRPKLAKHQREEALARKRNGETLTAIAKSYNVSHMTICRLET
jgi:DNA invertase Pin-like site-specific DNA recombinase